MKPFFGVEYTNDNASYFLTGIYFEDNLGELLEGNKSKFLLNTYTLKIDCKHNQQKMLHPKNVLKLITELKHKIDTLNKSCINCKYILDENDIPKQGYNIVPDLPNPLPPQLNPQTMDPIGPEDLAPLFPMGLILQEVSDQSYIDIPEPVLDLYKLYLSLIHI